MSIEIISKRMVLGLSMVMALVLPQISKANLVLRVQEAGDLGSLATFEDNTASDTESGGINGLITHSGAVGSFMMTVNIGTSDPIIGSKTSPALKMDSLSIFGGAGETLVVELTDTDYVAGAPINFNLFGAGDTDGSVNIRYFLDDSNMEFGQGTELYDTTPLTDDFDYDADALNLTPGGLYSLTILAEVTHTSAMQITDFDAQLNTVPEPGTFALLGLGLIGLGVYRKKRS